MSQSIAVVRLTPYMDQSMVTAVFHSSAKAIIIQSYTSGYLPLDQHDLETNIREAVDRNVIVVNMSQNYNDAQCDHQQNQHLKALGVLGSGDMTFYATIAKLSHLFGKHDSDVRAIRSEFLKDLRGELTEHKEEFKFGIEEKAMIQNLKQCFKYRSPQNSELMKMIIIPNIQNHLIQQGFLNILKFMKEEGEDSQTN